MNIIPVLSAQAGGSEPLGSSTAGAPMVLYVRADAGMTIEQYRALFEAAKEFTPPDASVFLEQG